jgi:hypothetical protein
MFKIDSASVERAKRETRITHANRAADEPVIQHAGRLRRGCNPQYFLDGNGGLRFANPPHVLL